MDDQNMNIESKAGFFSKSYLKHIAVLLGLIFLVGGGFFIWAGYFSPEAKNIQKVEKSMAELPGKIEAYKKNMAADIYGGKTPEETLQMFIDALKQGDIELASKYFALDSDTARPDPTHFENLSSAQKNGRIQEIINFLQQAERDKDLEGASDDSVWLVVIDDDEVIADINIELNKYSKVWKIESL